MLNVIKVKLLSERTSGVPPVIFSSIRPYVTPSIKVGILRGKSSFLFQRRVSIKLYLMTFEDDKTRPLNILWKRTYMKIICCWHMMFVGGGQGYFLSQEIGK